MELATRVAKLREMEAWEAKLEAEKTNADLGSADRVCFGASYTLFTSPPENPSD